MNIYRELKDRNFLYQESDAQHIEQKLTTEKVKFYVGFDPTGSSLHVGHLLPVMGMRMLQQAGHVPIVLVGGATAQIGDPSGRISARPVLTKEEVAANAESIKNQLSRFISVDQGEAYFVNNLDWFKDINYIDFLREIGYKFSVNRMLAQESVKQRLENGLSFLEFNYSIMQAYDFYVLNRDLGCELEFGGQDQWGNMVAGVDLTRRMNQHEVFAMTLPLLLDSNGKKFGKSSGGMNVWLDKNRTPVFDYYQFWRNCDDGQVETLLGYFTTLPMEEVRRLGGDAANINRAKEILAYEATKLAHGAAEAKQAYLAAGVKFGFADPDLQVATTSDVGKIDIRSAADSALPSFDAASALFEGDGYWIVKLLTDSGMCKSSGEARRLIQGGGAYLNDERISDVNFAVKREMLNGSSFILKSGKKNMKKIHIV